MSLSLLIKKGANLPSRLIFDSSRGAVELIEKRGFRIQIPYTEFKGFFARSLPRNRHILYLEKRDGAYWDLILKNSQKTIELLCEQLNSKINWSQVSRLSTEPPPLYTLGIEKKETPHSLVWTWKNPTSISYGFFSMLAVVAFAALLASLSPHRIISGTIAGIFSLVLGMMALKFASSFHQLHQLELSRESLSYSTGREKNFLRVRKKILLKELCSTQALFNVYGQPPGIYFLSPPERENLKEILNGQFELKQIPSLIRNYFGHGFISLLGWSYSKIFLLEREIDQGLERLAKS